MAIGCLACLPTPDLRGPPIKKGGSFWGSSPSFSADGKTLAIAARGPSEIGDVFVVDLETGSISQVTHNAAYDAEPAMSASGERLCFVSERDGNGELYLYSPEIALPRRLTFTRRIYEFAPAFLNDDDTLVYVEREREGLLNRSEVDQLFILDLATMQKRLLTGVAFHGIKGVRATNGGQEVLVHTSSTTFRVMVDGGSVREIQEINQYVVKGILQDPLEIVYAKMTDSSDEWLYRYEIYLHNVEADTDSRLTYSAIGYIQEVGITHDNRLLAFAITGQSDCPLIVMDRNGTIVKRLEPGHLFCQ